MHVISDQVFTVASPDGEFLDQDRLGVVHGRLARPDRADEAVMNASVARQLGLHVGDVMHLGLFASRTSVAKLRVNVKLVGIVVFNNQVIQDDIDAAYGLVVLTPALLREATRLAPAAVSPVSNGVQLDGGARDVATVEREIISLFPKGAAYEFHASAPVVSQVEDAIKPESIALGAFGVIAALVTLVIAAQAISRQLRADDDDRQLLRALGAGPAVTTADGLPGVLGSIGAGSVVAVAVAVVLSPLTLLGPVKPVYPGAGIALDWAVLGLGFAGLVVILSATAFVIAYRHAPHRLARRGQQTRARFTRRARGRRRGRADSGRDGHPVRVRARCRPRRGAGAFDPDRDDARRRPRRRDTHLRERSAHVGVASVAVRLELELHDQSEPGGPPADTRAPRS